MSFLWFLWLSRIRYKCFMAVVPLASSISPLVPPLLTKNCVLIWFYGLCAHCCLMLHSYGVCCMLPLIGLVRRGVFEISNTRKQIPLILCLVGSLTLFLALPCGAGIYLVMGFSGNSFQLFDLLLIPHAPPPPLRYHSYHSNWKHCQFSNSPRLPIPLAPVVRLPSVKMHPQNHPS